ncbi:MAG TPA: site-specific integrase [Arachidicoccus sp.]|nr:site-specific integrase [Arachidicoccus sp.]
MKNNRAEAKITLDTRRIKKDDTYPVKLKVTFKRIRKYYNTTYNLTEQDWQLAKEPNTRGERRKLKLELAEIETKAQACCNEISPFSFKEFESQFFPKVIEPTDLKTAFDIYIDELKDQERYGSADNYNSSKVSLLKFKSKISLDEITPQFLNKYEKLLLMDGKSPTTVGIYLRPLRAIINRAIEQGLVSRDSYPFGRGKYQILGGRNIKKALSKEELMAISSYEASSDTSRAMYKDLWMFSFFCNGMNVADICHLQNKDIQDGFILYQRRKNINKYKANPKIIRVAATESVMAIIEKWQGNGNSPEDYIFPFLDHTMNAYQKKIRTKEITHNLNDNMKAVAKALNINKSVTSYTARHSYATLMKRLGASTEFISESFGHSSVAVTNKYLDSFENETVSQYAIQLQNIFK